MEYSPLVTNAVQHADGVTGFGLKAGEGTVTVSWRTPAPSRRLATRAVTAAPGTSWPTRLGAVGQPATACWAWAAVWARG